MPWYHGPTLMAPGRPVPSSTTAPAAAPLRLPVQWVNRPNLDFRGFCGCSPAARCAGRARPRAALGARERVARIVTADGDRRRPWPAVGDAHARRRGRHLARRRDLGADARPRWPTSSNAPWCGWPTSRCCRAALPAEDRHAHRRRDGHRAQVQGQREHAGAPGGQAARAQRDRRVQPRARPRRSPSTPTPTTATPAASS
jgi:hypothetical protein